jgi:hypothetical protein
MVMKNNHFRLTHACPIVPRFSHAAARPRFTTMALRILLQNLIYTLIFLLILFKTTFSFTFHSCHFLKTEGNVAERLSTAWPVPSSYFFHFHSVFVDMCTVIICHSNQPPSGCSLSVY